jgi:hypothetical protein
MGEVMSRDGEKLQISERGTQNIERGTLNAEERWHYDRARTGTMATEWQELAIRKMSHDAGGWARMGRDEG